MLKKLSYAGALMILAFLFGFYLWQQQVRKNASNNEQRISITIRNVSCAAGKGQSSLSFVDKGNKVKHIPVDERTCYQYKKGDTLTLLYNENEGWYLPASKYE